MSDVYQVKAHSKGTASTTLSSCPNEGGKRSLQIVEGHWIPFQVPTCIAMPPKHPVASVIGFRKRKSAIAIMRLSGKERNFSGEPFWARGYAGSTVGFEREQVRQYVPISTLTTRRDGQRCQSGMSY